MKNFVFKEMLLVSFLEKTGRRIPFHPKVTIIRGNNEMGKSSLIKSIMRTFGAEPTKVHPRWLKADVRSVIRFEVTGTEYALLRYGNRFAAFDAGGKLIGRFRSVTKELAPFLANLLDFGLRLPTREGEFVPLPPAYYFLPFYMDQDASWGETWAGFAKLDQFANWRRGVIEYHAGIRGNTYYEAQAEKLDAESEANKLRRRRENLQQVYDDLSTRFESAQFSVDFSAYRSEVDELLRHCDVLHRQEEEFKAKITDLWNHRDSLKTQHAIAIHAREESKKDFEYAISLNEDHVACPTCGANYTSSFAERFSIALDEDHCTSLALRLSDEIAEVDAKIKGELEKASKVAAELGSIEKLLAKREGEVALRDVIQQAGRKELHDVMRGDIVKLEWQENREVARGSAAVKRMTRLDSKERRREVNGFYSDRMQSYLSALDVHGVQDQDILRVDRRIGGTGSELPRALLAFQFAFFEVMERYGSSKLAPIVIDSPNQQDQDDSHLKKILQFINYRKPQNSQLILGLVDTLGMQFGGSEIVLENRYGLLREDEFQSVGSEVQRFVDVALE